MARSAADLHRRGRATDPLFSECAGLVQQRHQAYTLFESKGFNVARDWFDWLPDGKTNGYLYDSIHPNARGMNVAAHKIREWINTLSGPRIEGEIPAWSE